ncbi:hypothetical protein K440DRAFT_644208 [Wilcoxina mikolae CBS 423.85]|nr:hypothetical protein K440DRAFT_644208 [Wilcoxina mikolae CBS 423.85]
MSQPTDGPDVVCRPAKWYDPVIFITLNYVVHVFTTRSDPGEDPFQAFGIRLLALLVPYSNLVKIHGSFLRIPIFLRYRWKKEELSLAKCAGALCCVVPVAGEYGNSKWRLPSGEMSQATFVRAVPFWERYSLGMLRQSSSSYITPRIRPTTGKNWTADLPPRARVVIEAMSRTVPVSEVHGAIPDPLPPGYCLRVVPEYETVRPLQNTTNDGQQKTLQSQVPPPVILSKTKNELKSIAAIGQLIAAIYVLWKARGKQLDTFGYAAYSLTVIPYALLSLLNFLVSLAVPEYPMLYVVRNNAMKKLTAEGWHFEGVVGELEEDTIQKTGTRSTPEHELTDNSPDKSASELESLPELFNNKLYVKGAISPTNDVLALECIWETPEGSSSRAIMPRSQNAVAVIDIYVPLIHNVKDLSTQYKDLWPLLNRRSLKSVFMCIFLVWVAVPFVMILGLSGFRSQQSTLLQRGWLMAWYVGQFFFGPVIRSWVNRDERRRFRMTIGKRAMQGFQICFLPLVFGVGRGTWGWVRVLLRARFCLVRKLARFAAR